MSFPDYTNYELFQLEKYGNILPSVETSTGKEELENSFAEQSRQAEWVEMQHELSLCEQQ